MTGRLLVLALLLHHIEGVCKPFSAATLAARRIIAGFVERAVSRDRTAATDRARLRQISAIERARAGRRQPAALPVRGRTPEAIEAAKPVPSWTDRVRQDWRQS